MDTFPSDARSPSSQWQERFDHAERPLTRSSDDSVEQHAFHARSSSATTAQSPRRLSVFSGRARSNTTASTNSSRRSPASSMTSADLISLHSSQEEKTSHFVLPRLVEKESKTKSLLSRGSRILRRKGSRFNVVATLDEEEDEAERDRSKFEVADLFGRGHRLRQSDSQRDLKRMISEPFDFHHLTHTNHSHFKSLETLRQTDFITEFSAIRASQRPHLGLKGINANHVHFRNFSLENIVHGIATVGDNLAALNVTSPSFYESSDVSPPVSPQRQPYDTSVRSRSVENFSRPGPRPKKSYVSPILNTSPDLAGSPMLSEPFHVVSQAPEQNRREHPNPMSPNLTENGDPSIAHMQEAYCPSSPLSGSDPSTVRPAAVYTHLSDLQDVPEDREIVSLWNETPIPSHRHPAVPQQSPHSRRLRAVAQRNSAGVSKSGLSIFTQDDLSAKFFGMLASPTCPSHSPKEHSSPDFESSPTEIPGVSDSNVYESWYEDIDYCYEHAAESNSNFDWSRNSLDEERCSETDSGIAAPPNKGSFPQKSPLRQSPDLVKEVQAPQHLPSGSEVSHRSLDHARVVVTPSTPAYQKAMVIPAERSLDEAYFEADNFGKSIPPDSFYDELLAADGSSDRHFPFGPQSAFQPAEQLTSPRSSFSLLSKCNSQESLMLSRAASVVRKHRSSISATSVPELEHSTSGNRDFAILPENSLDSSEPIATAPFAPMASADRLVSPHHRHTKSLAPELENHIMPRASSNACFELASSACDRTRSASDADAGVLQSAMRSPPPRTPKSRKARASYSLFPVVGSAM